MGKNKLKKNQLGIIGSGGFAREVMQMAKNIRIQSKTWFDQIYFVEFDEYFKKEIVDQEKVIKLSDCNPEKMKFVIGISNPTIKKKILNDLPFEIEFTSLISPYSFLAENVKYGEGLIVMPFCYLSCNVKFGKHAHVNNHCAIGHDTEIGDFFTSAGSVNIAGNNFISDCCFFGMNSSTKQGIKISNNINIGLNSGVIKNLTKPGTYFGSPAKFLFK